MTRVDFEGVRTTDRTVAMIQEARKLFGDTVDISQGGYNAGGVAASAGTHDLDAIDFKTRLMSDGNSKRFELCLWRVGFAAWRRQFIRNLWPIHTHCIPKGGDISPAADNQVTDFHHGLNGLKGHGDYPGILASGYAYRTWEQYQASNPPTPTPGPVTPTPTPTPFGSSVSLAVLVRDFTDRRTDPVNVPLVQQALNLHLSLALAVDGDPGPHTKAAYQQWQTHLGYTGSNADGIPGRTSLTKLGLVVNP